MPIQLKGTPPGVKNEGGILEQVLREVEIECLPADIPSHLDVDVTKLAFGAGHSRVRSAALRQDQVPHRREPDRGPRDGDQGRSWRRLRRRCGSCGCCDPAEPEVVKKGKQETEGGEAAKPAEEVRVRAKLATGVRKTAQVMVQREADRRARQSRHRVPVHAAQRGFPGDRPMAERAGHAGEQPPLPGTNGQSAASGQEVVLAKPETFMNLSGLSVRALVEEFGCSRSSDLLVIYDELDLPLGTLRESGSAEAGGHNGVKSINGALGTEEMARIRIGVGPDGGDSDPAGRITC